MLKSRFDEKNLKAYFARDESPRTKSLGQAWLHVKSTYDGVLSDVVVLEKITGKTKQNNLGFPR